MRVLALALFFPLVTLANNSDEFNELDLNRDGRVSLAEAAGHGEVVVRFDRADRNRDGRLTLAEYDRLKTLKIRPPRPPRSAAVGGTRPPRKN